LIIVGKKGVSEAVLATDRAEHGTKQQFLSCCIMAKYYADVALLLPKGNFYAEMFCITFPCLSLCRKANTNFMPTALINGFHPN